jgi:hypothetical protein
MKPTFPIKSQSAVTLRKIISGVLFCFVGALSALGGDLSFRLPGTPFASDGSYRFEYWTEIGRVKASSATAKEVLEIPLHLGFNPVSTYTSPLGYGFEFALFDSHLVWQSDLSKGSEIEITRTAQDGKKNIRKMKREEFSILFFDIEPTLNQFLASHTHE